MFLPKADKGVGLMLGCCVSHALIGRGHNVLDKPTDPVGCPALTCIICANLHMC